MLDLLRLGAYQVLRTRIPPHAAVATTVDLARAVGHGRAAGFVNAVLRRVAARGLGRAGSTELADRRARRCGALALRTAHPEWIVDGVRRRARRRPRRDRARALAADDERPLTHLVAWPGRIDRDELLAAPAASAGPYSPYAVRLDGGDPAALAAVRERPRRRPGRGQPAVRARAGAAPRSTGRDERWLDLCAGPGGKAALLAALAAERGARLTAERAAPAPGRTGPPGRPRRGRSRSGSATRASCPPIDGGYDRVLRRRAVHRARRAAPPAGGALAPRRRTTSPSWPRCSASCSPRRCGSSVRAASSPT